MFNLWFITILAIIQLPFKTIVKQFFYTIIIKPLDWRKQYSLIYGPLGLGPVSNSNTKRKIKVERNKREQIIILT